MLDNQDMSTSTLRQVFWEAIKDYAVQDLLRLIRDEDAIVRTYAAKQLHLRATDEVFEEAEQLVASSEHDLREIGAFLLGQLGTPKKPYRSQSLPLLVPLVRDQCHEVRAAAISAVGHLGVDSLIDSHSAVGCIIEASRDKIPEVRAAAAFSLSSFSDEGQTVPVLQRLTKDSDNDVREWAELSLEIIDERGKPGQEK